MYFLIGALNMLLLNDIIFLSLKLRKGIWEVKKSVF